MPHLVQLCSCEDKQRGPLGPVADYELVARAVINPTHIAKKGGLKPGLFPLSHIQKIGLSLVRIDPITAPELERQGRAIAAAVLPGKDGVQPTLAGFVTCMVHNLRGELLAESPSRALCVHDDPTLQDGKLPANPAHAIVVGTLDHDDSEIERLRLRLVDLFSPLVQAADAFR